MLNIFVLASFLGLGAKLAGTPPGIGASQSQIDLFLDDLAGAPESHTHDHDSSMADEHMAAMNLAPRGAATHVAIGNGDWFDPIIWSNGEVPGDDARVLIPDGVTVGYNEVSDARLFTVRIDGALDFATDTDSQMVFDTMVVSPTGHLIIGSEGDPVDADVSVDLIVANNGPIDTNWDPLLLSRGIIAHGETKIHGAEKDSHEKVTDDPMAGDDTIKMAGGTPEGWQVGDKVVIAGTHYIGSIWDESVRDVVRQPSEDEVRIITKIDSDGTIHLDEALVFDHDSPRSDLKTSVANYTRNVSIETENADTAEVFERGHVMFMHSDDVDVRYAEFHELGRTDKSTTSIKSEDNMDFDTNVQGRYSLHLHRTGVDDYSNPAIVEGNAVFGSPGWGFVHHDSHAELTNNASFDTFGSGFVAETGNETGSWNDNIAIYAEGTYWSSVGPKNTSNIGSNEFDVGRGGHGFWFQGRMVESIDNVAASVNEGFVYFHRDGDNTMIRISAEQFAYPDAMFHGEEIFADHASILSFQGNETFAAREGLHVVKANSRQEHDIHSRLEDFTAWSVKNGATLEYTSHYILSNFDLTAIEERPFFAPNEGISFGNNTSDMIVIDAKISGFEVGIDLHKHFTSSEFSKDQHDYVIIDADISNVETEYSGYDPRYDSIISKNDLSNGEPSIDLDDDRLYWASTSSDRELYITGTKTDSIGESPFPGGNDRIRLKDEDIKQMLEKVGYWETSSGERYTLADLYFTDRGTGEIYYETQPIFIGPASLGSGYFQDAKFNGTQDFSIQNGVEMAGDRPLGETIPAGDPYEHFESNHQMTMSAMPAQNQLTMTESMDFLGSPSLEVSEDAFFLNTDSIADLDLIVSGGTAVIAANGSEFNLSEGRTLSVLEHSALVGFDGDDGELAVLDLHEGSDVVFSARGGDLGTIEEIASGAFGEEPNVLSGIDLGNSTLSIELSGLSADAGTLFTLMDADEIAGLFDEAVVDGLGARDASILVDYENDNVVLQLSSGTGTVSVETLGEQTAVTSGAELLWQALTADQPVLSDGDTSITGEEEDVGMLVA